jgi:chemotaxis protein histidine kinase CheA
MTKRFFFGIFKPAFKKAFSEENIRSAWSKTGLWPYNPDVVLDAIRARLNTDKNNKKDDELPRNPDGEVKTLYTAKSIRRFQMHYARNPTKDLQRKLFKANEVLAAEREINAYRAECLKRALALEKTKRKKPKRLNLLGQEATGEPQFYGPDEVREARRVQAEKTAQEEQEKVEKAAKKVKDAEEREAKKAREAAEKTARAEKKEVDRQVAREAKAQAKIEAAEARKAATAAKKAAATAEKAPKSAKTTRVVILKVRSTFLASLGSEDHVDVEEVESDGGVVPIATRRGRRINLPVRLRE